MQLYLPLTSLILYLTVHLRLDSASEPELAHFLEHGMLIPHLVMSDVQINCIPGKGLAKPSSLQAWNQTSWSGNWNEKERKREVLLEWEKGERMNCLVSQCYQFYRLFFFYGLLFEKPLEEIFPNLLLQ